MNTDRTTGAAEWRAYWGIVVAGFLGYGYVALPSITLGLFMEPLQREFGWGRAEISFGMTIFALVSTPLVPFAGALADRFGSRRVAVPGLLLTTVSFAAFALLTSAYWLYLVLWTVYALTQLPIRSAVWNRSASEAFTASRGLALAVMMAGIPLAQTMAPVLAEWLIETHGWRMAYAALGLGWGGFCFLVALLVFREPARAAIPSLPGTCAPPPPANGGLSLAEAMRDSRVMRIALAMMLQSAMAAAISIHLFSMVTEAGLSRSAAAGIIALLGASAVVGQLATGWLADRVSSAALPVVCFGMPAIAYALLLQQGSTASLTLAVMIAGYAASSCMTITTYLTSRYAGVAHFGKIFGVISSGMGLGSGIGPLVAGGIFDRSGNYEMFLMIGIAMSLLAALAVFRLGPYPDYTTRRFAADPSGKE